MRKNVVKDFSQLSELIERKGSVSFDKPISTPVKLKKNVVVVKPFEKKDNMHPAVSTYLENLTLAPEKNNESQTESPIEEIRNAETKAQYQEQWKEKDFIHKKMVAKKNRRWLEENRSKTELNTYDEFPDIYKHIDSLLDSPTKRKWLIHILSNFLPLNRTTLVPKLPADRNVCPITKFHLTDVKHIKTGDRDKHLAFTGDNTTVVLCGIAVQELYRCAINYTYDFYSPKGQIINFCIDNLRQKEVND